MTPIDKVTGKLMRHRKGKIAVTDHPRSKGTTDFKVD